MYRVNFILFVCILSCFAVVAHTQDNAAPQPAPENQAAAAPAPVALIAGMTVDDILKSLKAPVIETYRGTITETVTGAIVIIDRNGTALTARLYGVDSPEPGQAYYKECRQFIMDRFAGEGVNISVVATDNQANPVVLVFNSNGESLNHLMVAYGMAWWDRLNAQKDALLRRLNAEAISNSVGLYADPAALAPWDYRDSHGMEQFTYTLGGQASPEPEARTTQPSPTKKEEPKVLAAKGTMTKNAVRTQVNIPKDIGQQIDPLALMGKHQPDIARDESGNVLGLTAKDISQIPFAAQLGFQDNDIISSVNGIPVQSIDQIMMMAPQFEGVKDFDVNVIRNGQQITIPITIN